MLANEFYTTYISDDPDAEDHDIYFFENPSYDSAFVGMTDDGRPVYDFDEMVQSLMDEDGMTEIDALDFIGYNTIRALPFIPESGRPIILHNYEEEYAYFLKTRPKDKKN